MAPHVFVDRWVLLQLLFLGVVYPLHGLWAEMQLLAGWMVRFWQHLGCPWLLCWGNPDETDETTMNQMRWEYMNTRQRAFRIDPETSRFSHLLNIMGTYLISTEIQPTTFSNSNIPGFCSIIDMDLNWLSFSLKITQIHPSESAFFFFQSHKVNRFFLPGRSCQICC